MTKSKSSTTTHPSATTRAPTKLERVLVELGRKEGSTLDELCAATGWQKHSVRGALAGTLKRRGHVIMSEKVDGLRRYRLEAKA